MSLIIENCPRCGARAVTFDVTAHVLRGLEHNWADVHELFSVCRHCEQPSIFVVTLKDSEYEGNFDSGNKIVEYPRALNKFYKVNGYISIKDQNSHPAPELLGADLKNAFDEAARCLSVDCFNASASMFRLCVDMVTRPLLPPEEDIESSQPNAKQRRDLGLRLQWLFDHERLDPSLKELASCIREDGNDAAHQGNLTREDAEDLMDFTFTLLEKLVTEPRRLQRAEERRKARRQAK